MIVNSLQIDVEFLSFYGDISSYGDGEYDQGDLIDYFEDMEYNRVVIF